jgi:long-chain fatty acid transport protein
MKNRVSMTKRRKQLLSSILLGGALIGAAQAGALQSLPQSAASLGLALAGSAALADNADTSYYNPAASPWIQHQDAGFSLNTNLSDNRFSGAEQVSPAITGFTANGRAQGGGLQYLPAIFYTAPVSQKWAVGFNVTAPYQANLNYGSSAFTRYSLSKFYFNTIDIGPSFGYRFIPSLAVGFGLDAQYASMDFNQVSTTTAVANDVLSKSSSHGWGWGWNGGAIWQPTKTTRFGFTYRSQVVHHMGGNSKAYAAGLSRSRLRINLMTPSQFIFSAYQNIKTKWDMLATATYTRWSKMANLNLTGLSTQSGIQDQRVFKQLHDSWYFAGGLRYHYTQAFLVKTALGYQQAAVKNNRQTLLAPNMSHMILALGANYSITSKVSVDAGYSHYFQNNNKANVAHSTPSGTVNDNGEFGEGQDIFGVQLNWLMT